MVISRCGLGTGADIFVLGGNTQHAWAMIGQGGWGSNNEINANYLQGNIIIEANGDLVVEAGGRTPAVVTNDANDDTISVFAMIGNGGTDTDSMLKAGDITVTVGGDLFVTGGVYGQSFAMVGHGGLGSEGQVGGDFNRTIQVADETGTDGNFVTSNTGAPGADKALRKLSANIVVDVEGNITMDHLENDKDDIWANGAVATLKRNFNDSFTLIGHGGADTTDNTGTVNNQFWNKTGDVTVSAGGSLTMSNGTGWNSFYTRIGHGANRADRQSDGREVLYQWECGGGRGYLFDHECQCRGQCVW